MASAGGGFKFKATLLLVLFLLASALATRCVVEGSRTMQMAASLSLKKKTKKMAPLGYIPQAKLIPPSGPSERHNSIGLQDKEDLKHKHKP